MNNVHLWQYLVIAGPAAILGGLVVWAVNREYVRGLEDVVLSEPDRKPEIVVPMAEAEKVAEARRRTALYMLGEAYRSAAARQRSLS